jgi:hypothetical protein
MMRILLALLVAATAFAIAARADDSVSSVQEDENLLSEAKLKSDGSALLEFFRKRTGKDADLERLVKLIPKLGDENFAIRWSAAEEIRGIEPAQAVPGVLRRSGLSHPDEEVRDQCRVLIRRIEKQLGASPKLAAAAARLMRVRKPDGCLTVLLAYLPFAADEQAEDEVLTSIAILAVKNDKVDSSLAAALKDPVAARKGVAALLLGRSGSVDEKKAVTALLDDGDTLIRLRAAQGLIAGHDKSAVPALIALLTDGTLDEAVHAEDMLACIAAGQRGPRIPLGDSEAGRKKCREAWTTWWTANEDKVNLAKADVDLSAFNPTLKMRETIRRLLVAFNRADSEAVLNLAEAPFYCGQVYSTREALEPELTNVLIACHQSALTNGASSLVTLEEYLKTAPPQEKELLAQLKTRNHWVLRVNTFAGGQYAPGNAMFHAFMFHVEGPQVRLQGVMLELR